RLAAVREPRCHWSGDFVLVQTSYWSWPTGGVGKKRAAHRITFPSERRRAQTAVGSSRMVKNRRWLMPQFLRAASGQIAEASSRICVHLRYVLSQSSVALTASSLPRL